MRNVTKSFLAATLLCGSMMANAFTYEGIDYAITSSANATCSVMKGTAAYPDTLVIPSVVVNNGKEYTVTGIKACAFDLCTNMVSITFPPTLEVIDSAAFFKPTKLKTINVLGKIPADISSSPFASTIYTGATLNVPEGCWLTYQKSWPRFIYVNEPGTFNATVDGMNFNIMSPTDKYARLRSATPKYSGDFVVPATIKYNDVEYKVVEIGAYAFDGCADLKSVTMPEGLLAVNTYSMRKANLLDTVIFPSTVEFFATGVFQNCTGIKMVDMSSKATRVENVTFQNCTALQKVILPQNCVYVGASCFSGCKLLETLENYSKLTTIMSGVFQDTPLLNMELPAGLTTLENTAFKNSGVTFTVYPEGLKKVDANTFYGCKNLRNVVINHELTMLGSQCFAFCENLESIKLPEKTPATFAISVLRDCPKLTKVELPKDLTFLPAQTFYNDTSLVAVNIPETVTAFHNDVFNRCSKLQNFTLPPKTESLAKGVFSYCSSLTEFTLPETVTLIGAQLFSYCTNLKKVRMSSNIELLNSFTFYNCPVLTTVEGIDSITTLANSAFAGCTALTEFTVPKKIKSLWNNAFANCPNLKSITLPEGLDSIAKQSFLNCTSLTEITIPASMKYIMEKTFNGCTALNKVKVAGATPATLKADTFDEATYTNATLQVLDKNAATAYAEAEYWKNFTHVKSNVAIADADAYPVYGEAGRIVAPEDAKIYTLQGSRVNAENLPAGIYLVVANGCTYKVVVK